MEDIYLESSVISYITSEPSDNILLYSKQLISNKWWRNYSNLYNIYISQPIIAEISKGNDKKAQNRLDFVRNLPILNFDPDISELVKQYMGHFGLNSKLELDITHIAYTVYYEIDFLLTWNCAHIANAHFRHQIINYNIKNNLHIPELCTPEELIEEGGKK